MGKFSKSLFVAITLCTCVGCNLINAQNIILKGGDIVVKQGTFVVIQGDLQVKASPLDSKIDLNGTILLQGNIENNSTGSVFYNQEPIPNGWVVMPTLTSVQTIKGITPIAFENIYLSGFEKRLENTNSSVNGIFRLNAVFNLNSRNFILNNKDISSLEHNGGYLFAETNPTQGIGSFQWTISNNIGTYKVPFGTGYTNNADIAITFQSINAGSNGGSILFSTYPTDFLNNPYPEFINNLVPYEPLQTADRFWIIDGDSYTSKPTSNISLQYTQNDIESGNNISETSLKPIMYSPYSHLWTEHPAYTNDITTNTMSILNIPPQSLMRNWTISSDEVAADIFFPNAFSPDLDGTNETFKPVISFIPKEYVIYIYNRWGQLVFTSTNPNIGWDGTFQDATCQIGCYSWIAKLIKPNGKLQHYTGNVSIIK